MRGIGKKNPHCLKKVWISHSAFSQKALKIRRVKSLLVCSNACHARVVCGGGKKKSNVIQWLGICVQFKLGRKLSQRWYVYYQRQERMCMAEITREDHSIACALKLVTVTQCQTFKLDIHGPLGYPLTFPFQAPPLPSRAQLSLHCCASKLCNTLCSFSCKTFHLLPAYLNTFLCDKLNASTFRAHYLWMLPPLLITVPLCSSVALFRPSLWQGPAQRANYLHAVTNCKVHRWPHQNVSLFHYGLKAVHQQELGS